MYQIFYIEIDEEVTSIIDRIKRSSARNVVFVIPARALVFNSVVSLRIIYSKAREMGVYVIIVTPDRHSQDLAKRSGFEVFASIDDIEGIENSISEFSNVEHNVEERYEVDDNDDESLEGGASSFVSSIPTPKTLERVEINAPLGSSYSMNSIKRPVRRVRGDISAPARRDSSVGVRVTSPGASSRSMTPSGAPRSIASNMVQRQEIPNMTPRVSESTKTDANSVTSNSQGYFSKPAQPASERKPEYVQITQGTKSDYSRFAQLAQKAPDVAKEEVKKEKDEIMHIKVKGQNAFQSKKLKIVFSVFMAVCVAMIVGISAYLFLPEADVHIVPQSNIEEIDVSAKALTDLMSVDVSNNAVRARKIEVTETRVSNFSSTGEDYASSQKARGKIKIYNNYSASEQPLVATTRFESEDGKIFRLVDTVTVPGITEENGIVKPGVVDAEVEADKSGEEYNIEATKFSIPGFKSSGKFEKFYAVSEKKMMGGGSWGDKVKIILQDDIDKAKVAVNKEAEEKILEALKANLPEGYVLDELSVKTEVVEEYAFPAKGVVSDNFEYSVTLKAVAMSFSENDLKEVVKNLVDKNDNNKTNLEMVDVSIEYGQISSVLDENYSDISAHATVRFQFKVDEEEVKKIFLGVKNKNLKSLVSEHNEFKKVDVEFRPSFISRSIPNNPKRVNIIVEKE